MLNEESAPSWQTVEAKRRQRDAENTLTQLSMAYESVCAALQAERERSKTITATIEIMRAYGTKPMHSITAMTTCIRDLTDARRALREELADRDATIAALHRSINDLRIEMMNMRPPTETNL